MLGVKGFDFGVAPLNRLIISRPIVRDPKRVLRYAIKSRVARARDFPTKG